MCLSALILLCHGVVSFPSIYEFWMFQCPNVSSVSFIIQISFLILFYYHMNSKMTSNTIDYQEVSSEDQLFDNKLSLYSFYSITKFILCCKMLQIALFRRIILSFVLDRHGIFNKNKKLALSLTLKLYYANSLLPLICFLLQ